MTLRIGDLRALGASPTGGDVSRGEVAGGEVQQPRRRSRSSGSALPQPDSSLGIGSLLVRPSESFVPSSQPVAPGETRRRGEPGTVLEVSADGRDVSRVLVVKPAGFSFQAGQHMKLGLPGHGSCSYTIASAPHEENLQFCIERIQGGRLSPRLTAVRPGERLLLSTRAKGKFVAAASADLHVFIATTTGIAPFRSMLLDGLHRRVGARYLILHGASYADQLPYRRELQQLSAERPNVIYQATVSRPGDARNAGWQGEQTRVDELARRVLPQALQGARSPRIYACGNASMISNVRSQWASQNVPVVSESFD